MPAVWTGGAAPAVVLLGRGLTGGLGADPVSAALNQLGLLTLVVLLLCLACTPVQLVTRWTWPARVRRALGLLAFGYGSAHLLVYAGLDLGLRLGQLAEDLLKRPFITVGFLGWLAMLPLALTSTQASVRRLGFPRWKRLHRLAYAAAALGVLHFVWRAKKDLREPLVYAAVLGVLLLVRAVEAGRKAQRRAAAARDAADP